MNRTTGSGLAALMHREWGGPFGTVERIPCQIFCQQIQRPKRPYPPHWCLLIPISVVPRVANLSFDSCLSMPYNAPTRRAIAYGYLFRHPERSRPRGGVAQGPLLVAEETE